MMVVHVHILKVKVIFQSPYQLWGLLRCKRLLPSVFLFLQSNERVYGFLQIDFDGLVLFLLESCAQI